MLSFLVVLMSILYLKAEADHAAFFRFLIYCFEYRFELHTLSDQKDFPTTFLHIT